MKSGKSLEKLRFNRRVRDREKHIKQFKQTLNLGNPLGTWKRIVLTRALVTRALNGKDGHTYILDAKNHWTNYRGSNGDVLRCNHQDCDKTLEPDMLVYSRTTTTRKRYYCPECYESLWL